MKKFFDIVKKKGRLYQSNDFAVSFFKRGDQEVSRFGFIVSAKISKKAVVRNKIRRVFKEIIRLNIIDFPEGFDMVFLAKKSIIRKTQPEIEGQVRKFLEKLIYFK